MKDSPVYYHEKTPELRGGCFRSGITGGLVLPKKMETPEKFFDVEADKHIKKVWLDAYLLFISVGETREISRMKAEEALEDYLEKFT